MESTKATEVINNLQSDGAFYRVRGILQCVDLHFVNDSVIFSLENLKSDSVMILGYPVSAFAHAALECLGIETYTGDDSDIHRIIKELPKMAEGYDNAIIS